MEIAALVSFLSPVVQYLLKTGEPIAEDAARAVGDKAWGFAKRLWARLSPSVEGQPGVRAAVEDVAADPSDEDLQAQLRVQLKKLLQADPQLAQELDAIWKDGEAAGIVQPVTGDRNVVTGGSVTRSTIITGDQANVGR